LSACNSSTSSNDFTIQQFVVSAEQKKRVKYQQQTALDIPTPIPDIDSTENTQKTDNVVSIVSTSVWKMIIIYTMSNLTDYPAASGLQKPHLLQQVLNTENNHQIMCHRKKLSNRKRIY
jgi:hypothetical protein